MSNTDGTWEPPQAPQQVPQASEQVWPTPTEPPVQAQPVQAQPPAQPFHAAPVAAQPEQAQPVPISQPAASWAAPVAPTQPAAAQPHSLGGSPQETPWVAQTPEYLGASPETPAKSGGFQAPLRIIGLIVGLLAFGGLGFAASQGIFGNDTGAESANEAVQEMMQAMEDEDVIAMMEVMSPGEIGRLAEFYPRFISLAQDEGALVGDDPLAGIDITVEGLVTEPMSMHPDVEKVYLREGVIKIKINPDEMDPAVRQEWEASGDTRTEYELNMVELQEEMNSAVRVGGRDLEDAAAAFGVDLDIANPSGTYFMTVKQNGRWYVSPFYTGAEYGRELLSLPPADFTASRENRIEGAPSAEAVFTGLEEMVNSDTLQGHLESALAMDSDAFSEMGVFLPPQELGVFMDYGPSYTTLFERIFQDAMGSQEQVMEELLAEFQEELDQVDLQGQMTLDINTSTEDMANGSVKVYLDSGSLNVNGSAVDAGEVINFDATLNWDGLCGWGEAVINGQSEIEERECIDPVELAQGEPEMAQFAEDFDRVFVVVNKQDGAFYISYVDTGLAYADLILASMDAAN